jgi:hypothetical protein
MHIYKIILCWEDDHTDNEMKDTALVFADSYADAVEIIEKGHYKYLNSMSIEDVADVNDPILYIPQTESMTLQDIIDENIY